MRFKKSGKVTTPPAGASAVRPRGRVSSASFCADLPDAAMVAAPPTACAGGLPPRLAPGGHGGSLREPEVDSRNRSPLADAVEESMRQQQSATHQRVAASRATQARLERKSSDKACYGAAVDDQKAGGAASPGRRPPQRCARVFRDMFDGEAAVELVHEHEHEVAAAAAAGGGGGSGAGAHDLLDAAMAEHENGAAAAAMKRSGSLKRPIPPSSRVADLGAHRGKPEPRGSRGKARPKKEQDKDLPPGVIRDCAALLAHKAAAFNVDRAGGASGAGTLKNAQSDIKRFVRWVIANKRKVPSLHDLVDLGAAVWIKDYWMDYAERELRIIRRNK